ncbi:MAG: hypothetical protein KatS3mg002_1166 [Candidatus Woesearchaeota archaeon]|nr:MAG: hypothetical protein KatS3mg002_1166 [Candidatus Woesearchaeota archaeon]
MSNNKKDKKEKNRSIRNIIMLLLIIILIILIIIFFPKIAKKTDTNSDQYLYGDKKVIYNYYIFNKREDNIWYLDLSIKNKPYIIPFYYTPFDVENISIDNNTIPTLALFNKRKNPKIMYISIDPNGHSKIAVAAFEIKRLLGTDYDIFNFDVRYGTHYFYESNSTQYPVATCENARPDRIIIIINVTGENSITTKNNCIILNAYDYNETVRVADAFSYRILGIINELTIKRI